MSTFRTSAVPVSPSLALRRWWASNNSYSLFPICYFTLTKQYLMVGIEKIAESHILNILYKEGFKPYSRSSSSTHCLQVNPQWSENLIQEAPIKMVSTRIVSIKYFKNFHDIEQKCKGVSQGSCILRSVVEVGLLATLRCSSFKLNY